MDGLGFAGGGHESEQRTETALHSAPQAAELYVFRTSLSGVCVCVCGGGGFN